MLDLGEVRLGGMVLAINAIMEYKTWPVAAERLFACLENKVREMAVGEKSSLKKR